MNHRVKPALVLVRHGEVAHHHRNVCYGRSDVELSDIGMQQSRELVEVLGDWPITSLWHSDLCRTRDLAEPLGARLGLVPIACADLKELHFGDWELRPWQELYDRHGDDVGKILSEPDSYRPGGGETVGEMRDRVVRWLAAVEPVGLTVAIVHAGPIAVIRGVCQGLSVARWPELIPRFGSFVRFELAAGAWQECSESGSVDSLSTMVQV